MLSRLDLAYGLAVPMAITSLYGTGAMVGFTLESNGNSAGWRLERNPAVVVRDAVIYSGMITATAFFREYRPGNCHQGRV